MCVSDDDRKCCDRARRGPEKASRRWGISAGSGEERKKGLQSSRSGLGAGKCGFPGRDHSAHLAWG